MEEFKLKDSDVFIKVGSREFPYAYKIVDLYIHKDILSRFKSSDKVSLCAENLRPSWGYESNADGDYRIRSMGWYNGSDEEILERVRKEFKDIVKRIEGRDVSSKEQILHIRDTRERKNTMDNLESVFIIAAKRVDCDKQQHFDLYIHEDELNKCTVSYCILGEDVIHKDMWGYSSSRYPGYRYLSSFINVTDIILDNLRQILADSTKILKESQVKAYPTIMIDSTGAREI